MEVSPDRLISPNRQVGIASEGLDSENNNLTIRSHFIFTTFTIIKAVVAAIIMNIINCASDVLSWDILIDVLLCKVITINIIIIIIITIITTKRTLLSGAHQIHYDHPLHHRCHFNSPHSGKACIWSLDMKTFSPGLWGLAKRNQKVTQYGRSEFKGISGPRSKDFMFFEESRNDPPVRNFTRCTGVTFSVNFKTNPGKIRESYLCLKAFETIGYQGHAQVIKGNNFTNNNFIIIIVYLLFTWEWLTDWLSYRILWDLI